jgi:hypothetical protein
MKKLILSSFILFALSFNTFAAIKNPIFVEKQKSHASEYKEKKCKDGKTTIIMCTKVTASGNLECVSTEYKDGSDCIFTHDLDRNTTVSSGSGC